MENNINKESDNNSNDILENLKVEIIPDDFSYYDITFKIIVIGDSFVGKSCLTTNGIKNIFDETYSATVGFEFVTTNIKINDKVCKLQIWDTCGQEVYRSLITSFYRNSSLAILVYSIDNLDSFDNLDIWLKELKTYSCPDAKIFLIGNKADLESKRVIDKQMGEKYKIDNYLDYFTEASAKTGLNTQKIFIEAAKILYLDWKKYKDEKSFSSKSRSSSVGSSIIDKIKRSQLNEPNNKKEGCNC